MTMLAYAEGLLWSRRNKPIMDGYDLLRPLSKSHRIMVATTGSAEMLEHHLRMERLHNDVHGTLTEADGIAGVPLWRRQFEVARSRYPLDLVIAADPTIVEWAVDHGVTALFFCHPGFNVPSRRAERGRTKWDDLVTEMEARL